MLKHDAQLPCAVLESTQALKRASAAVSHCSSLNEAPKKRLSASLRWHLIRWPASDAS